MSETPVFTCCICEADSRDICMHCTKDACPNHLCIRCFRCSDCCDCEVPRTAAVIAQPPPRNGTVPDAGTEHY